MSRSLRAGRLIAWFGWCVLGVASLVGFGVGSSSAATVVARDARWITLKANTRGVALISYYTHGQTFHTIAWGAKNALPPSRVSPQVRFSLNYAGGYGSFLGAGYWRVVGRQNACGPYRGPAFWHAVAACTMPDRSEERRVGKEGRSRGAADQ